MYSHPQYGGKEFERFPSLYESMLPLDIVKKSHFIDFFDGDTLDGIWGTTTDGTGTVAMGDIIDGGVLLTSSPNNNNDTAIHMSSIRHYSPTGSVIRSTLKVSSGASGSTFDMFLTDAVLGFANYIATQKFDTSTTWSLITNDGSSNSIDTLVSVDTNLHEHILEIKKTSGIYHLDGVLVATSTSNLPTKNLQPSHRVRSEDTISLNMNVLYVEVYNT